MSLWHSSLLVLGTAVLVIWIPQQLQPKREVVFGGSTDSKWQKVEDIFRLLVESGKEPGGAFAVYHNGKQVVNLYGGYADKEAGVPWRGDTLSCFYSTTKGVGAVLIAVLVDRGLIDYDEPVTTYWPEFGQNGKEKVTVRQLMSHQAGLAAFENPISVYQLINDQEEVARIAAAAKPLWKLGEGFGYHDVTFGIYLDELIRRVDPEHRDISQFFDEEIRKPFDVDFYIGLPRNEHYRVTRFHTSSLMETISQLIRHPEVIPLWSGLLLEDKTSLIYKAWHTFKEDVYMTINDPLVREVPFASGLGFGTAESMARFWGMLGNGGQIDGKELMKPDTVKMLEEPVISGQDKVVNLNVTFSVGTSIMESPDGTPISGHPGLGGQMGYMDTKHRLGWAYVTNHPTVALESDTYKTLIKAVYDVINKN